MRLDAISSFDTSLGPTQRAAVLGMGVMALMSMGVLPVLLGGLEATHRLSSAGIGLAASLQAFAVTIAAGLAASFVKPRRLRLVGAGVSLLLAIADLAVVWVPTEADILLARGAAGLCEGMLFWIATSAIARVATSERLAGLLLTLSTAMSLGAAALMSAFVLPAFGVDGGFALLAGLSLLGVVIARWLPSEYPPVEAPRSAGWLPSRGWASLLATMLYTAAGMGCFIYLAPLATSSGLGPGVAATALTGLLAAQLLGGALASGIAGRVGYFVVLGGSTVGYFCALPLFVAHAGAPVFLAAAAALGFLNFFSIPFLYPLTIAADSSRRTAIQSGPAQLLGSALGPLLAVWASAVWGVIGIVYMSAALLVVALIFILAVEFLGRSSPVSSASRLSMPSNIK